MLAPFIKLRPDNFTCLQKTPWAGTRIAQTLKSEISTPCPSHIGESWEFSTCPDMPSLCDSHFNGSLCELLNDDKRAQFWLSPEHIKKWNRQTPLLIKYIDADDALSLQLHPPVNDPNLPIGQCGKWEAWLILHHEKNAGIYLGLKPNVTKKDFVNCLKTQGDIRKFLHFITVKTGDFFSIPPRTIHVLGAGLCILEPQLTAPGKLPVSLRLYDWKRKYDASGNLSDNGSPRPLQIQKAIDYMDFSAPRGPELEKLSKKAPKIILKNDDFQILLHAPTPCLKMRVYIGTSRHIEKPWHEITSVIVIKGQLTIHADSEVSKLCAGESGVLAANVQKLEFCLSDAIVIMTYTIPTPDPLFDAI